jgi:hypothetical protein
MIALGMAMLIASGTPETPYIFASPANIAFAKANFAALKSKMDAAEARAPR